MQAETPSKGSGAAEPDAPGNAVRLGPFHVSTQAADVDAFRAETGWSAPPAEVQDRGVQDRGVKDRGVKDRVPHTFPMRWLSAPDVKDMVRAKMESAKGIAIHESQSFQYERPLAVDQDYLMSVEVEETATPPRLILRVSVATCRDQLCLRMETILRMVSGEPSK
jgi:hypothetical protein